MFVNNIHIEMCCKNKLTGVHGDIELHRSRASRSASSVGLVDLESCKVSLGELNSEVPVGSLRCVDVHAVEHSHFLEDLPLLRSQDQDVITA